MQHVSIAVTLLVFVGIPLAVCLLVAIAVYGTSNRNAPRYRPGRPFPFEPVWYVAARPPQASDSPVQPALPAVDVPAALPDGSGTESTAATPVTAPTGGARGSW